MKYPDYPMYVRNFFENYSKLLELLAKEDDTESRIQLAEDMAQALNACFISTSLVAKLSNQEDRDTAIKHFTDAMNHISTITNPDPTVILNGGNETN